MQGELATFTQGDHVGFLCDLLDRRIQFYLNGKLVGAIPSLASHIEYTPFVILGEGPFQVSINKVPTIAKVRVFMFVFVEQVVCCVVAYTLLLLASLTTVVLRLQSGFRQEAAKAKIVTRKRCLPVLFQT